MATSYLFGVANEVLCRVVERLPLREVEKLIVQYPLEAERLRFCVRRIGSEIGSVMTASETLRLLRVFPWIERVDVSIVQDSWAPEEIPVITQRIRGPLRLAILSTPKQSPIYLIARVRLSLYSRSDLHLIEQGDGLEVQYAANSRSLSLYIWNSDPWDKDFQDLVTTLPSNLVQELRIRTEFPLVIQGLRPRGYERPLSARKALTYLRSQPLTHLWVQVWISPDGTTISPLLLLVRNNLHITDITFFRTSLEPITVDSAFLTALHLASHAPTGYKRQYPTILRLHGLASDTNLQSLISIFPSLITT